MINEGERGTLTLREAALLAGVTEKIIRHEMAESVAKPRRAKGRPVFGPHDVAFFRLVANLPFVLDKSARKDLFEVIARKKGHKGGWRLVAGRLLLEGEVSAELMTADLFEEVTAAFSRFIKSKSRVVSRDDVLGGEPVFAGTRISIRHVGELVGKGVKLSELIEDFPALSADDIDFAVKFVALGRPPGRPKKLRFIRGGG